ncbi:MAG: hypothetical protein NZ480_01620 [Bdellovibrionaceae bacterium]|nr:hypothetical protein [Pseudobdellovibrionaceae bacterium]MDW8189828.1 hypothetical protein [Pseudobdellovibrionaceae bacterium]
MGSLKKALEEKKFDSRLIELHLQMGKFTMDEWKRFLNSLPDLSHNVAPINLDKQEQLSNPHKQQNH